MQECFPVGCVPSAAVAVWWGVSAHGGVCLGGICLGRSAWPGGVHLPPVDRILDTCFWKHYLSTTSFADGAPFWAFGKSWIHHCSSYSFYNILVQTDLTRRLQNLQGQTIAAETWLQVTEIRNTNIKYFNLQSFHDTVEHDSFGHKERFEIYLKLEYVCHCVWVNLLLYS